jgi:myo-inositol-1(or 4)-monophosphatase
VPDPAALLDFALEVAHRAGDVLVEMAGSEAVRSALRRDAARKSSATDLASAADRASEAVIVAALRSQRPRDGLVAEEGSSIESRSGVTWVVDPLDGTTNYLYGSPSYAVSIAATFAGEAVVGVVYDPSKQETFAAQLGGGATLNGCRLERVEPPIELNESLVGTGFGYRPPDRLRQARLLVAVLPSVRDIRRSGSAALDLCSLAAGRLDAYYEAGLKPWDTAAGLLICNEAGLAHESLASDVIHSTTLVVAKRPLLDELIALLHTAANGSTG